MSERHTVIRALHDVGLAAWFGGSLFGATGLNQAVKDVRDPSDRAFVAATGWYRWAPVEIAALSAHAVGGVGLIVANRGRIGTQKGVGANTAVKLGLTLTAAAVTGYSALLGGKIVKAGRQPAVSGTEPSAATPAPVAKAQKQLKVLQLAIPAMTGVLVVLGAQQGEQQKPGQVALGALKGAAKKVTSS